MLVFFLIIFNINATTKSHFTGYAGALGDMHPNVDSDFFDPQLCLQLFFMGQFDFNGNTIVRGGFNVKTEDIIEEGVFKDTPSTFRLDEFSITRMFKSYGATHYISAFVGTFEPIGSDVFLQRQFGISSIASELTQSWSGLSGSTIYPFFGTGLSYVFHPFLPIAAGFYGYYEYKEHTTDHEVSGKLLSTDLRFACNFNRFTVDIAGGLGFPIEDKYEEDDEENKVVLLIRTVDLHAGITMLLGNINSCSFLLQTGFRSMNIDPNHKDNYHICNDNRYFLGEFRARKDNFQISFTAFALPKETVNKDMPFIHDPLGFNFGVENGTADFKVGLNVSPCFNDYMDNVIDVVKDNIEDADIELKDMFNLYVDPFISWDIFKGNLKAHITLNVTDFNDEPKKSYNFILGYKSRL